MVNLLRTEVVNLNRIASVCQIISGVVNYTGTCNIHLAKRIVRKDGYFLIMEDETQLPVITEKIEEIIRFFD
ncbi:hypothetical protein GALL_167440 [mine drainage metagenome]|uniref:Uncharacterized protein n=1 Tax=mine drainage metagenome TaxID=410659 RepID=A0A1J5RYV0_9ZZZZ